MPIWTKNRDRNGKVSYNLDLTWPLVLLTLALSLVKLVLFPGMSWWAVTAPIWIIPAIILALVGFIILVWCLVSLWMLATGRPVRMKYTFRR